MDGVSASVSANGKSVKVTIGRKKPREEIRRVMEVLPVVSLLLTIINVLSDHHEEVGTLFYINAICTIAYECLEAYMRVSDIESAWANRNVHYAIVALTFCVGQVSTLMWELVHLILMTKATLKVAAANAPGDLAKTLKDLSENVNKNVYVKRAVAGLEILVAPWLFLMALVHMNGAWLLAFIVYVALFILYQLINDEQHKWWYSRAGQQLRSLANSNRDSFGKPLNQALDALKEVEKAARKLYPVSLIKIRKE